MQTNNKFHLTSDNKNGRKMINKVKIGDIFSLKINALGPKKTGLVELNNGLTLLIPNANLGDTVKVKLEKMFSIPDFEKKSNKNLSRKYGMASLVEVLKKGKNLIENFNLTEGLEIEPGKMLNLTIKRKGPKNSGLVPISDNFTIIIPNSQVGEDVKVEITKVKSTYAFGKVVKTESKFSNQQIASSYKRNLIKNKTYNILIPSNAKSVGNFFVFQLNGNFLFLKKNLGINYGDSVKILIIRTREKFLIAKVLKVNPISKYKKDEIVKNEVKKMIESGIHYGERAIRCNANMRSYIWLRKKGRNKNRPFLKRGRHVLNLLKTRLCLKKALFQLSKYAYLGQTFLFVGTKKSAASLIARTAVQSQTAFFVNSRWLGGMLTNWKTILKSISQIRPILKEKQKVIHNLLEKRKKIKERLFNKVNLLRLSSRKLMLKGKKFILELQNDPTYFIRKSQELMKFKTFFLIETKNLIENYSNLLVKQQKISAGMKFLKQKEAQLIQQKTFLKNMMQNDKNTFESFKKLFLIGQQLIQLKKEAQVNEKNVLAVSFEKFNFLYEENSDSNSLIPNPPTDILYKVLSAMKIKFDSFEMPSNFSSNRVKMNQSKSTNSTKTFILSKLLEKFTFYLPFIKNYMVLLIKRFENSKSIYEKFTNDLKQIHQKLKEFSELKMNIQKFLQNFLSTFSQKISFFKKLNQKLRQLSSQQRLLKFLPKLRFLPTTKNKMYERVELLMKKFIDPKISFPIDQIYDQKLKFTSKKIAATRKQKWQRLEKYFGGIPQMAKMRKTQISKNVAIIIGQQEEMNAVRECQKLGIKMFTVIDTNCNPKLSDHIIPANDDSRTSVQYILGQMLTSIRFAQKLRRKIARNKFLLSIQ